MKEMNVLSDEHGNVYEIVDAKARENAKTLGLAGVSAGKIAKIKAVDSSGKPTEWETVDMPQGGEGDYTLPMATPGELGGVKAGLATAGDNAPVRITMDGELRVAVPTDDHINGLIDAKFVGFESVLSDIADLAEEVSR